MERHATLYMQGGKQYLLARLEVDNNEDPTDMALWIEQCLEEGRMLEIEEGLYLERTPSNRWRVSFRPDPAPPPERPDWRYNAPQPPPPEPLPWRQNEAPVPAPAPAPVPEPLAEEPEPEREVGEVETDEPEWQPWESEPPEEPEPAPELRADPVLARALGLPSASAPVTAAPAAPLESPAERRERLLNRHSPLPSGRDASARENEERAVRFLLLGSNTADRVAMALGMTREGARKMLERLVHAEHVQRTAVDSGWRTSGKGVAAQVVYYHLPGQPPPTTAEVPSPNGHISSDQKILTAISVTPMTVAELVDATGHSAHTIRNRLKRLLAEKKVRELRSGHIPRWGPA